jgi:hypothetical protein
LWLLGLHVYRTRKHTTHISSGFYYIAKDAGVPVRFAGVDWRNKTVHFSPSIDPTTTSKDELLVLLQAFAAKFETAKSGKIPGNASTLAWRTKAKKDQ